MKTYKNLYPRICAFNSLLWAFHLAARGKRSKDSVASFEYHLEENLISLQTELRSQTYAPGEYHNFHIYDPKPRLISAAPFRDRVVHHALCQVIEPLFERRFIYDSYACRAGKGTHAALDRAQVFARCSPYVLKCDIEHFFPSIDHAILLAGLGRVIADRQTLWLCGQILASGAGLHRPEHTPRLFPGDDLFALARPTGLPIGNLTSQFWANVYLDPLDQYIKRQLKCPAYLRYVDDFLLFSDDKAELHRWRGAIIRFLQGLRLVLHEDQAAVFPVETGIPFLGWRVYPLHRRLKRRNGVAFQRRLARLLRLYAAGQIDLARLDASINGWVAHAAHGNTWGLRRALLSRKIIPKPGSQNQ
jgi:retron-type reverse transcriptase